MIEFKAPERLYDVKSIFLAGSIEMGKATPWQDKLVLDLSALNVVIYNPRRTDWDSSWTQDPTPGTKFNEQVTWELYHIQKSDIVVFYFDPETQSPITLMELGYCIGSHKDIVVCCPDGYFRKGNVVITCGLNNVSVLNTYEEFLDEIKNKLK
jgi:nucleoside 2-deoxyribosyltransferase